MGMLYGEHVVQLLEDLNRLAVEACLGRGLAGLGGAVSGLLSKFSPYASVHPHSTDCNTRYASVDDVPAVAWLSPGPVARPTRSQVSSRCVRPSRESGVGLTRGPCCRMLIVLMMQERQDDGGGGQDEYKDHIPCDGNKSSIQHSPGDRSLPSNIACDQPSTSNQQPATSNTPSATHPPWRFSRTHQLSPSMPLC